MRNSAVKLAIPIKPRAMQMIATQRNTRTKKRSFASAKRKTVLKFSFSAASAHQSRISIVEK